MGNTVITGQQIEDGTVGRVDLNITTSGNSVIAKALENGGAITLTSTGADAGTGDVTIVHRTGDPYNHIPTGGASGNYLKWVSSGLPSWTSISTSDFGATTVGNNLITLTNPSAISFLKISATNTVTTESATTHLTSLGGTTVGQSFFTLANPGAITYPQISATNVVSAISGSALVTALGISAFTYPSSTGVVVVTTGSTWGTTLANTTVGTNLLTLANPGAITFLKISATNTVTAESAATHLTSLGAQPLSTNLTSLAGLTYASTSFVKMTSANTFYLDTNTYVTSAGTVTAFSGSLAGDVTGTQGATVVGKINGTALSGLVTGLLKNTTVSGAISIAVAGTDYLTPSGSAASLTSFPTFNQNTTGTAANITATSNTSLTSLVNLTTIGAITVGSVPYSLLTGTVPTWNQNTTGVANINGGTVGAVPYQTGANATGVVAATTTASKMFLSGASAIPTWSTSTIPTSAGSTALKHLRSDGTNYILTTATISDTPSTAGKVLVSDGTNWITSTPTFPNASATTRKIIVSDGTNWVASTETYAVATTSGNILTSDGTNWTSAAPVFGAATTNTVTNKRIQERVYTTTSTATLTPEVAIYDMFVLTAQAAALTIANQSTSTPVDGEDMTFRIKDNATARAITYGTNYRSLVATMPTTTVLSKWLYIAFKWNATDSKWDCMAAGSQP